MPDSSISTSAPSPGQRGAPALGAAFLPASRFVALAAALAGLATLALPALGQAAAPTSAPRPPPAPERSRAAPADPLDAKAPVPAAAYRSPLANYRRWADNPVGSWREANETTLRAGGWRAYAREAEAANAAASPAGAASAPK
jgi:hypothetical protein